MIAASATADGLGLTLRRFNGRVIPFQFRVASPTPVQLVRQNAAIASAAAERQAAATVLQAGGNAIPLQTKPGENKLLEAMRVATLAGDWYALNELVPFRAPGLWNHPKKKRLGKAIQLGKFSFVWGADGRPRYVPFTAQQIYHYIDKYAPRRPAKYACPEKRKQKMTGRLAKKQRRRQRKIPSTDWRHVVDMFPGGLVCRRPKKSLWVKIRKPVAIAVAVVAAVYLGPMVYDKIGGFLAGGGEAGAAATTATQSAGFVSKVKTAVGFYNKASTVNAIIRGERPPPPIGISGSTFTEMAMSVAKDEFVREAQERAAQAGLEYIEKKMTAQEERQMRAEVEELQRELAALVPAGTPVAPDPGLQPEVREKINEMQNIERQRDTNALTLLAVAVPVGLLLAA